MKRTQISTYLDLVEEHVSLPTINQFEKVMVMAERAKDLYLGKTCLVDGLEGRKPTTKAQFEYSRHRIEPELAPEEPAEGDDQELEE